jgi:hypothetical protein
MRAGAPSLPRGGLGRGRAPQPDLRRSGGLKAGCAACRIFACQLFPARVGSPWIVEVGAAGPSSEIGALLRGPAATSQSRSCSQIETSGPRVDTGRRPLDGPRPACSSSNETQASMRGFATARGDRQAPEIPRTRFSSERSVRRGRLESVPHWRPDRYARPWIWSERRCDFPMAQQLGSG